MNKKSVKEIRQNGIEITNEPIVYYWWFKTDIFNQLLNKLNSEIDLNKIKRNQFDGIEYGLLYIGQAKKGHDRLVKYHMLDSSNFHLKGVENGFLSSLRTTLCGLLELPMSVSKNEVNQFMDENCVVEWENCTLLELNELEKNRIQGNYLPLNYQHTKGVLTKEHRKILSESKKLMRK
ncbi:hypothetical protein L3X37_15125 [Sabulilitoribacter arenilitoris]|uniref:GIY-YIG catalytic domain-containing protein n=1 Tax=Wocania arenilitoris TaxID=2044858 RepID=A0AAE3JLW6_9FLAO|nr:hypothetical protein [Wocania arenilitoris]MCF7569678.1 hypothetical protein [Wocania arenilitoris]